MEQIDETMNLKIELDVANIRASSYTSSQCHQQTRGPSERFRGGLHILPARSKDFPAEVHSALTKKVAQSAAQPNSSVSQEHGEDQSFPITTEEFHVPNTTSLIISASLFLVPQTQIGRAVFTTQYRAGPNLQSGLTPNLLLVSNYYYYLLVP